MNIKQIPAKAISYGGTRSLSSVKAIVIHYTGCKGDTAEAEGNYFAHGNTRSAGAHFFVGQNGSVVQSIPMERIAWAVGGARYSNYKSTGGAKYYGILKNANTVSIELCDNATKDPSDAQIKAVAELIKHIKRKCPNATMLVRHFDITGKSCAARMCNDAAWSTFQNRVGATGSKPKASDGQSAAKPAAGKPGGYTVRITATVLNVREKPSSSSRIMGKIRKGEVYTIVKESNGWGKLKSGIGWIYLKYAKKK